MKNSNEEGTSAMGKRAFWILAVCAASVIGAGAFAAEKKKDPKIEAEENEAREEDEAVIGKDIVGGHEFTARGKFVLNDTDVEKPVVVGAFIAEGKMYQVKIEREELRARLIPFHNKEVGLTGKLRNKGKYLVVQDITTDAVKPDAMRNRRGL